MRAWWPALTAAATAWPWEDVILPPKRPDAGGGVALIFAQGASIKTSQYVPIATALQGATAAPLWVAIPQCVDDACSLGLARAVERAMEALNVSGMPEGTPIYYGGHSLGGAMMPAYVKKYAADAPGMILMGSFLTEAYRTGVSAAGAPLYEFPVPTLTIGGELDGLCRLSRMAEAYENQVTAAYYGKRASTAEANESQAYENQVTAAYEKRASTAEANESQAYESRPTRARPTRPTRTEAYKRKQTSTETRLPVTIIKGLAHMGFASGPPPPFVARLDAGFDGARRPRGGRRGLRGLPEGDARRRREPRGSRERIPQRGGALDQRAPLGRL